MKKILTVALGLALALQLFCVAVVADTYTGTASPGSGAQPEKAFDSQPETKWWTTFDPATGAYLQQQLDTASKAYGYYFCTGKDTASYPGRNPSAWTITASNDGENWTEIVSVTGDETLERASMKYYYFWLDSATAEAYAYYRFEFLAIREGTVIQLAEAGIITEELYDRIQSTAAYTFVDGTLSAYGCPPEYLIDGQTGTKWCIDFFEDGEFVEWRMNKLTSITGYKMATGDDTGEKWGNGRNPVSWILYGSLDGENWTVIDEKNDDTTLRNVNCEYFTFELAEPSSSWLYFKFAPQKVETREKWILQLSEFELIVNSEKRTADENAPVFRGYQKSLASGGDTFALRLGATIPNHDLDAAGFLIDNGKVAVLSVSHLYYTELKGNVSGSVQSVVNSSNFGGKALITCALDDIPTSGKSIYTVTPVSFGKDGALYLGESLYRKLRQGGSYPERYSGFGSV